VNTVKRRSVLVTDGGTGIGKGCALRFLQSGATVTIAGPDGDVLASAAAELQEAAGRGTVRTAICDVTDEDLVQEVVATYWPVDLAAPLGPKFQSVSRTADIRHCPLRD
jgi:NAD(P)-dependent dehydrogenase (short-subunit alcohol dehydrogenase family)